MHSRTKIGWLTGVAVLLGRRRSLGAALAGAVRERRTRRSRASRATTPGAAASANCGLSLIGELAGGGAVQGSGHCAYVRGGGGVRVVDMSDPANPTLIRTLIPYDASETLRAVTTANRAVLVEGSSVWDIRDCENPVLKGEIQWRGLLPWPAGLHHDIKISHDGKKVYAGLGVVVADITNLEDPTTWTVRNYTCDVAKQYAHPMHPPGTDLCDQVDWEAHPTLAHGPGVNGDGTKWYVGNQTQQSTGNGELPTLRVLDTTVKPPRILGSTLGPGHSIDWFRTGGREYVLHANEIVAAPTSSCLPYAARTDELGFAHDAIITEVTNPTAPTQGVAGGAGHQQAGELRGQDASGQNTGVAYHSVDNPHDAHIAMVSMGDAGLRVFDIRNRQRRRRWRTSTAARCSTRAPPTTTPRAGPSGCPAATRSGCSRSSPRCAQRSGCRRRPTRPTPATRTAARPRQPTELGGGESAYYDACAGCRTASWSRSGACSPRTRRPT